MSINTRPPWCTRTMYTECDTLEAKCVAAGARGARFGVGPSLGVLGALTPAAPADAGSTARLRTLCAIPTAWSPSCCPRCRRRSGWWRRQWWPPGPRPRCTRTARYPPTSGSQRRTSTWWCRWVAAPAGCPTRAPAPGPPVTRVINSPAAPGPRGGPGPHLVRRFPAPQPHGRAVHPRVGRGRPPGALGPHSGAEARRLLPRRALRQRGRHHGRPAPEHTRNCAKQRQQGRDDGGQLAAAHGSPRRVRRARAQPAPRRPAGPRPPH